MGKYDHLIGKELVSGYWSWDSDGPAGEPRWSRPESQPDAIVSFPVGLNQSLIYRLLGDRTLHGADPAGARADGFERPVYYGLGSFGVACRALLRALCDGDIARFGHMQGRFSKPVHPGDRLDTLIWPTDGGAVFQTLANGERVVLDPGVFRFGAAEPSTSMRVNRRDAGYWKPQI